MAAQPLYYSTLEALLKVVRISPADDDNTVAAVDQAVRDVRLGLFSRLGRGRAKEIALLPLVENPDTTDEILRAQAASAEALWLTLLLIQRLPTLFLDNSSSVNDAFNDEPITRDAMHLASSKKAIQGQLDDLLNDMADDTSSLSGSVRSSLNGSATPYLISENFPGAPFNAY